MEKIKLLGVKLNNVCNLNCEMCGQKKQISNKKYIDKNILKIVVQQLQEVEKYFEVYLWGGEPFLHPDFFDICKDLTDMHLKVTVNTNGTKLYKYADEICNSRIMRVIVSIDGTRELHNQIRRADVYDEIVDGIKKIKRERKILPFLTSNTVITERNYAYLPQIVDTIFSIGIEFIEVQLPIFFTEKEGKNYEKWCLYNCKVFGDSWKGFLGDYSRIDVSKLTSDIESLKKIYKQRIHFVPNILSKDIQAYFSSTIQCKDNNICMACTHQIRIEADRSIVVCPDFPDIVMGNIYKENILSIMSKEPYCSIREKLAIAPQHSLCHKCLFRYENSNKSIESTI